MVPAVLVLYGAVLFVNAFFLLGRADGKAAGPINAIVGLIGVVVGLYTAATNTLGPASGFVAALVMIFGITFLIVSAMLFGALDGRAVGWYCVFGSIACLLWAWGFFSNYRSISNGIFSISRTSESAAKRTIAPCAKLNTPEALKMSTRPSATSE